MPIKLVRVWMFENRFWRWELLYYSRLITNNPHVGHVGNILKRLLSGVRTLFHFYRSGRLIEPRRLLYSFDFYHRLSYLIDLAPFVPLNGHLFVYKEG